MKKVYFNPEFAVAIYCGLQILAAPLVSRFYSSTYLWICHRRKIAPTARFATVFCTSLRYLLQNLGFNETSFKTGNLIDFGGGNANRKIIERGTC